MFVALVALVRSSERAGGGESCRVVRLLLRAGLWLCRIGRRLALLVTDWLFTSIRAARVIGVVWRTASPRRACWSSSSPPSPPDSTLCTYTAARPARTAERCRCGSRSRTTWACRSCRTQSDSTSLDRWTLDGQSLEKRKAADGSERVSGSVEEWRGGGGSHWRPGELGSRSAHTAWESRVSVVRAPPAGWLSGRVAGTNNQTDAFEIEPLRQPPLGMQARAVSAATRRATPQPRTAPQDNTLTLSSCSNHRRLPCTCPSAPSLAYRISCRATHRSSLTFSAFHPFLCRRRRPPFLCSLAR